MLSNPSENKTMANGQRNTFTTTQTILIALLPNLAATFISPLVTYLPSVYLLAAFVITLILAWHLVHNPRSRVLTIVSSLGLVALTLGTFYSIADASQNPDGHILDAQEACLKSVNFGDHSRKSIKISIDRSEQIKGEVFVNIGYIDKMVGGELDLQVFYCDRFEDFWSNGSRLINVSKLNIKWGNKVGVYLMHKPNCNRRIAISAMPMFREVPIP